jgi:hypothetical protein
MQLLALATVLWLATPSASNQPACDLVPEKQLPNCHFTARSNYALHGNVHTFRVLKEDISPDPRQGQSKIAAGPKLFIQEPGVWIAFSRDGELAGIGNVLSPDGVPLQPTREKRVVEGSKTIVTSGTPNDPNAFRREEIYGADGQLTDQFAYERGKLVSHQIHRREGDGDWSEDFVYDGNGALSTHSIERTDSHGRNIESMVFDRNRLILHQRDTYAESDDSDDDCALISRSWYDAKGSMFREITLRNRVATSWWQKPGCGEICSTQSDGVGLNMPFDRTVSYYFERDGSVLTTIEHHEGRYGNIDNDEVELLDAQSRLLEKIGYKYVRDSHGNWTSRIASILNVATGEMVDVRVDKRDLTYYGNQ